nr:MAG TPA: hypothetical protein [Caudoviricetes sp.]
MSFSIIILTFVYIYTLPLVNAFPFIFYLFPR